MEDRLVEQRLGHRLRRRPVVFNAGAFAEDDCCAAVRGAEVQHAVVTKFSHPGTLLARWSRYSSVRAGRRGAGWGSASPLKGSRPASKKLCPDLALLWRQRRSLDAEDRLISQAPQPLSERIESQQSSVRPAALLCPLGRHK